MLRLVPSAATRSEGVVPPAPRARAVVQAAHPLRVLVVDDDALNRRIAEYVLRERGHRVLSVSSGQAALDVLAHEPFEAVLLDVEMPEMDGPTTARALRARESSGAPGTGLRILALTAGGRAGDEERCLRAGMDAVVFKPFEPAGLFAALEAVRVSPVASEASAASATATPAPSFDLAELLLRAGDSRALAAEAVAIFREDAPGLVLALVGAFRSGEPERVRAGAHRLRGALLTLGAAPAAAVCEVIERAASTGALFHAQARLDQLDAELARLDAELQRTFAQASPAAR